MVDIYDHVSAGAKEYRRVKNLSQELWQICF